jgi:hypothetical protein
MANAGRTVPTALKPRAPAWLQFQMDRWEDLDHAWPGTLADFKGIKPKYRPRTRVD